MVKNLMNLKSCFYRSEITSFQTIDWESAERFDQKIDSKLAHQGYEFTTRVAILKSSNDSDKVYTSREAADRCPALVQGLE